MFIKKTLWFVMLLLMINFLTGSIILADEIDDLFKQYENNDKEFEKLEIGDIIVYWHQRMIDDATVEKDQIVYRFDKMKNELIDKIVQWREGLPEHITINISSQEAEILADGEPLFSKLYIISPESDVFPLDPTPINPCWVVRTMEDEEMNIAVIDAVTGDFLGYGIPPPYKSFSFSGPQYDYPCWGTWNSWYESAENWFNTMGYNCEGDEWPIQSKIQSHIQNDSTGMFYELAHGGSSYFAHGCPGGSSFEYTYSSDIENWIAAYHEMRFAFIGSCGGMCDIGDGSFSYAFRKGLDSLTATVGYCGMGEDYCGDCWSYSISWQNTLFFWMNQGETVKYAFDIAQSYYPACSGSNNCMRFAGDEDFAGPYTRIMEPPGYEYLPGDANMYNGSWPPEIIGGDVTYLTNYFRGFTSSQPCLLDGFWASADANGDCSVIGSDVTKLVNYFRGMGVISWCPDYEPAWLTPGDLPAEAPDGWPDCE